jgi:TonB-linked SusC/RagA family outer membrane protein
MQVLGGLLMERVLVVKSSFLNGRTHFLRAVGMSLLFALTLSGVAFGQNVPISGTVTSTGGTPLQGVTVRIQGSDTRAVTNGAGKYFLSAAPDAVLTFSYVGQRPVQITVAGRSVIDITMAQIPYLEEVVVTAYTEQRRGDITGAVSSLNIESAQRETGASVLQRLDASVPGVTVVAGGSPGSRSTVRIRGISSFQNNDPLYIIDGTPVSESYLNFLNPNDITSVQVLKDASAASIYGARASNGVVVIETTKRGVAGPPQVTLRARTGVASPVRGYDDFLILNSLDYFKVMAAGYTNAGAAIPTNIYGDPSNPSVPNYIWPNNCTATAPTCVNVVTAFDSYGRPVSVNPAAYSFPNSLIMPGSQGTNWWAAVFGSAPVSDYNLDVAGGSDENAYRVSFNYFDQGGTAKYNNFKRGSVRVNTTFNRGKLSFGEHMALALDRHRGGMPDDPGNYAEDGIMGKNILMQPVVPIYDIDGNFAGSKAKTLGNGGSPLKAAYMAKDDYTNNDQVFGNVFAGLDMTPQASFRTRLGFNVAQRRTNSFSPPSPEFAEASFNNSIGENRNENTDWTWTNTLRYVKSFSRHNFDLLLGQEANAGNNRYIQASIGNLLNTAVDSRYIQDALGQASTKNVFTTGGRSSLLSLFGKIDYNFAEKYVASATLRRDGSSRLAPGHQWGTFPAFGLGWRVSNEPFMANNRLVSDLMLRFGWGVTGNQFIPSGRIVALFGGDRGDTYYDVAGANGGIAPGFRQSSLGNPDLKWEENKSTNVGADMVLFNGMFNVVVDVYTRATSNLLFDPRLPATAGLAAPPIVNVGKMKNTGIDFSIGHQAASWSVSFNGSHYKNEIVSIDGVQNFFFGPITTRFGNQIINKVGSPIGSFYGKVTDGFFQTQAEATAHTANAAGVCATPPCQNGAAPGRFKFKDIDGDGVITAADRTIIGSPHPDFTAGLDLGVRRGNWDLNATFFGTFGNDIFENQKEFYIFREFETNVRSDLLANSWTPQNPNAKYPRIDNSDTFSSELSNFYIEDGSYIRLRNVQLGYAIPSSFSRFVPSGSRVYLQGENLFTKTDYPGLDPSLPAANISGAAGDVRDQYRGVDRGAYPSNKVFSIGFVTSF